ncbi:50S ribosomal protein L28 [Patescibacteria group bacterium AH-259-L07]|nr:50S ribosomal protein L28 [Patescibacteria group bacterium AH-259-L07]
MARKCTICGRGPATAISRSHSNVATKRRQYLNLQTKKISGKRVKLCTRCLKTLKKNSKI